MNFYLNTVDSKQALTEMPAKKWEQNNKNLQGQREWRQKKSTDERCQPRVC